MAQDRFSRSLPAGEVLFREGDPGHDAYVIESGCVEIFQDRPDGRRTLAQLGRNQIFGEMALVGDQTRTASAIATEPTVLTVVTHQYLTERLSHADPLLRHLLHTTMARSRQSLRQAQGWADESEDGAEPAAARTSEIKDQDQALKRLRLEQDIERALENREFQLHFQPIVRLADNSVAGFEALIRWFRPGIGRVPPNEFVWVAEDSGLIVKIGHWIIQSACESLNRLDAVNRVAAPGSPPLSMSINLSIRQFSDPDLFPTLQQTIEREQLPPRRVRLEITESLVMSNMEAVLALLHRCKRLGCKLVVDDFGTGYSALSYLHKLPVDTLKLDQSFIRDVAAEGAGMKIIRGIARLATDLGMETVIEGVETAAQAQDCRLAGVTYAQGFHYSPGLALQPAGEFLQKQAAAARAG